MRVEAREMHRVAAELHVQRLAQRARARTTEHLGRLRETDEADRRLVTLMACDTVRRNGTNVNGPMVPTSGKLVCCTRSVRNPSISQMMHVGRSGGASASTPSSSASAASASPPSSPACAIIAANFSRCFAICSIARCCARFLRSFFWSDVGLAVAAAAAAAAARVASCDQ